MVHTHNNGRMIYFFFILCFFKLFTFNLLSEATLVFTLLSEANLIFNLNFLIFKVSWWSACNDDAKDMRANAVVPLAER